MNAQEENTMVSWWKRFIYSFVSAVLGAGVSGACGAAQQVVSNAHGHLSAMAVWTAILFFDPWVIALSLPGWFLALPLVFLVRNVRGWRFWMYWVVGICLGPTIVLLVNWIATTRGFSLAGIPGGLNAAVYLAGAISGLSSLIYLLLLRQSQTRATHCTSAAVV
jgi:hypothetical protein